MDWLGMESKSKERIFLSGRGVDWLGKDCSWEGFSCRGRVWTGYTEKTRFLFAVKLSGI